jgi:type I restriction enzyme R subunit
MDTPSFKEDHSSQVPALQLLMQLGWTYLPPAEALRVRGGRTGQVLLEEVLRKQLKAINAEKRLSSTRSTYMSDANIENGIRALKELPMHEGLMAASETAYNLLTLGKTLEQTVDGDRKSLTLQYMDWKERENNVYHVTEEYRVMRTSGSEHYRPDIVLFVNGIPLCVIECKRPELKEPLRQAISQHLRNQQEDGIPGLYAYAQLVMGVAVNDASYATGGTQEEFWAKWHEKHGSKEETEAWQQRLTNLRNTPLGEAEKALLFADRTAAERAYFDALEQGPIAPTVQDGLLVSLCSRERLLDLMFGSILFENGTKKVARYQQYFAIKKAMGRLGTLENGRRKGGVIWHTQGSGKSLTMVMLAQAIAMEPSIKNPKIVLVTDRTDLDDQITKTFRKCGMPVENASTGTRLSELLQGTGDAVVTTVINKFAAAVRRMPAPLDSPDIFVLVDEGHRTQHGIFNIDMQKVLPNACFIAMTGTPLFKREKNTARQFGGIIDAYTVDEAVRDKAVVPLLYEGRLAYQEVNDRALDTFFGMVSEPLTEYQRADLKKKYNRFDHLNAAEQKMYAIAWDISRHYRDNWKGTGFKAQLVCDSKLSAVRYKEFLDEHKVVSTELLISAPDEREGEETAYASSSDKVKQFWGRMMAEHGKNARTYEKQVISRFKHQDDPEIIIVVDKLLTGFDEPKNTVLYLTRNLQGHKLLQAIARVNRVCAGKEFGYIIDYYGVIGNLDEALTMYSALGEFDAEDVEGTMVDIREEVKKLPQKHSELWDVFKGIPNRLDLEAYQHHLRHDDVRAEFYDKLAAYAKALKLALSSMDFHKETDEETIGRYKKDLALFTNLRSLVVGRYSDAVNYRHYEAQIQKLIDTHVTTEKVEVITELVNIFDKEKFAQEVEQTVGSAAKADRIASRTAKHISEKMEEDPAFYKKFSQLLRETIADHEAKRISEVQYLERVQGIMNDVLSRTDSEMPAALRNHEVARAVFGLAHELLSEKMKDATVVREIATQSGLAIDEMIRAAVLDNGRPVIDWPGKSNITGKLLIDIGDHLIDEVRDKYEIELSYKETDELAQLCINVAAKHYK